MRITAKNPWGIKNGIDAQRADLWALDLGPLLTSQSKSLLASVTPSAGLSFPSYLYSRSLTLPELTVRAEPYRRDSKPYPFPSWDEMLGPIKAVFVHDAVVSGSPNRPSQIYTLLNYWRQLARAGRGGMSTEDPIELNDHFKIDYQFDLQLTFFRGLTPDEVDTLIAESLAGEGDAAVSGTLTAQNSLASSSTYVLKRTWLSTLGMNELSQEDSKYLTITATLYADDIVQKM